MIRITDSIGAPAGDELDPRDPQALLEELGRVGRDRPGHHAADVVPVGDVRRPGDQPLPVEDRHREHDVVQVRDAAVERVVGDEDVARADRARAVVQLEDARHGLVEHPDERRDAGAGGGEVAVGRR